MGKSYVKVTIRVVDSEQASFDDECDDGVLDVLFTYSICNCSFNYEHCDQEDGRVCISTDANDLGEWEDESYEKFIEFIDIARIKEKYGENAELQIIINRTE